MSLFTRRTGGKSNLIVSGGGTRGDMFDDLDIDSFKSRNGTTVKARSRVSVDDFFDDQDKDALFTRVRGKAQRSPRTVAVFGDDDGRFVSARTNRFRHSDEDNFGTMGHSFSPTGRHRSSDVSNDLFLDNGFDDTDQILSRNIGSSLGKLSTKECTETDTKSNYKAVQKKDKIGGKDTDIEGDVARQTSTKKHALLKSETGTKGGKQIQSDSSALFDAKHIADRSDLTALSEDGKRVVTKQVKDTSIKKQQSSDFTTSKGGGFSSSRGRGQLVRSDDGTIEKKETSSKKEEKIESSSEQIITSSGRGGKPHVVEKKQHSIQKDESFEQSTEKNKLHVGKDGRVTEQKERSSIKEGNQETTTSKIKSAGVEGRDKSAIKAKTESKKKGTFEAAHEATETTKYRDPVTGKEKLEIKDHAVGRKADFEAGKKESTTMKQILGRDGKATKTYEKKDSSTSKKANFENLSEKSHTTTRDDGALVTTKSSSSSKQTINEGNKEKVKQVDRPTKDGVEFKQAGELQYSSQMSADESKSRRRLQPSEKFRPRRPEPESPCPSTPATPISPLASPAAAKIPIFPKDGGRSRPVGKATRTVQEPIVTFPESPVPSGKTSRLSSVSSDYGTSYVSSVPSTPDTVVNQ